MKKVVFRGDFRLMFSANKVRFINRILLGLYLDFIRILFGFLLDPLRIILLFK